MALEYTLMMDNTLDLTEITKIVSTLPSVEVHSDYFKLPGMTIDIEEADSEDIEFIEKQFYFTPNLSLIFAQDKFADAQLAHSNLITTTMALLNNTDGDAILDFNGDTILLRRIKNQLFLYLDDRDFWKPVLLEIITIPYEFAVTYPNINFNQAIYLEPAVAKWINQIALKKHKSINEIVNTQLKQNMVCA